MAKTRTIWCAGCQTDVEARLTNGKEIWPNRPDLAKKPIWRCDTCKNYVGCHHRHHNQRYRLNPTGVIATPALRNARMKIHELIDPYWKQGWVRRGKLYQRIAKGLDQDRYHTAQIRTIEEARQVYRVARDVVSKLTPP